MRDILKTLIGLMDKEEGLEQKSNDWERARRRHIDWGHIRKFWGRLWKNKKRKEKGSWNLPSLKDKLKIKEGECLSRLWKAKEISINKKKEKKERD